MKYSFDREKYISDSISAYKNILEIISKNRDIHISICKIRKELGKIYDIPFVEYHMKVKRDTKNKDVVKIRNMKNEIVYTLLDIKYINLEECISKIKNIINGGIKDGKLI